MTIFMKYLICFFLFTLNSFAYDCSTQEENLFYPELEWFKVSESFVSSSVENIDGRFCIGFKDKKLMRVHYFDYTGNKVFKSSKELLNGDSIFFSRKLLPGFVQKITRKSDPLSIGIKNLGNNSYFINIKFVENLFRGLGRMKMRLLKVKLDYSQEVPRLFFRGREFNRFTIDITNTLRLKTLFFYKDKKQVIGLKSKFLPLSSRR